MTTGPPLHLNERLNELRVHKNRPRKRSLEIHRVHDVAPQLSWFRRFSVESCAAFRVEISSPPSGRPGGIFCSENGQLFFVWIELVHLALDIQILPAVWCFNCFIGIFWWSEYLLSRCLNAYRVGIFRSTCKPYVWVVEPPIEIIHPYTLLRIYRSRSIVRPGAAPCMIHSILLLMVQKIWRNQLR